MKIILNQDVYNLGEEGDVCEVANGYARNFLLPQGFAVPFNNANIALFKSKAASINKRKEEKRSAALSLKEKLQGTTLSIKMNAGESGKLFGAVTSQSIVEALMKEGIEIDKKKVDVPSNTIKMVGNYQVLVKLYEKESAIVKLTVLSDRDDQIAAAKESASVEETPVVVEEIVEEETVVEEATEESVEE